MAEYGTPPEAAKGLPDPEAASWLDALRTALAGGLPTETAAEVVGFYEEYWLDALESGRTADEVAARLGSPERIVAQTLSERSIRAAEAKPGPLALVAAARRTAKANAIASAAGRAALGTAAVLPLLAGLAMYLVAIALLFGAAAAVALTILESPLVPISASDVRIGLAGLALFFGSALLGSGWLAWKGGNGLTRLTMRMLRRSLRKAAPDAASADTASGTAGRRRAGGVGRILRKGLAIGLMLAFGGGAAMLAATDLGIEYLSVWLSRTPKHVVATDKAFAADGVTGIRIDAQYSRITIGTVPGDEVTVTMGTPDWMAPTCTLADGLLTVAETPNGRLPFFRFVAIHEGVTEIRIGVPEGKALDLLDVLSTGSYVSVGVPAATLSVHTTTGAIDLLARYYPTIPDGVHSSSGRVDLWTPLE